MADEVAYLCPSCGSEFTHINEVLVASAGGQEVSIAAAGEDENGRLDIDHVDPDSLVGIPLRDVGRRHGIWLTGTCEQCPTVFWIGYRQHKGQTMLSVDIARRPDVVS